MKVYVLMDWQKGAWQPDHIVMGVFPTMEAAEKQIQEYKEDGFGISGMHIEEHEMKQNNCQGCGCINENQCICMKEDIRLKEELTNIMKEQYKGKYITHHPAGVDITFNSWEEYNKYMVYENKIRKEYCDNAYETGIKDVVALKQKTSKTETVEYPEKKDTPATYVNVEVKVKADSVAEFIDIWDVLYPKEK